MPPAFAGMAEILAEDHIECSVKTVLDAPMVARRVGEHRDGLDAAGTNGLTMLGTDGVAPT
ncbi:hypothetical protein ACCUM_2497 [Candidatus Accumulibacter phosphatis]|uniref:Uncharacterized protein n=1 Tax=Candidatus Accumulibacter phosphatis TaxID=327160 RepID=A0A5S4EHW0_9PROT|nr:hypothetical protein ACCUM_2497 [Candidatus Accumulibacter phosphatis]